MDGDLVITPSMVPPVVECSEKRYNTNLIIFSAIERNLTKKNIAKQ